MTLFKMLRTTERSASSLCAAIVAKGAVAIPLLKQHLQQKQKNWTALIEKVDALGVKSKPLFSVLLALKTSKAKYRPALLRALKATGVRNDALKAYYIALLSDTTVKLEDRESQIILAVFRKTDKQIASVVTASALRFTAHRGQEMKYYRLWQRSQGERKRDRLETYRNYKELRANHQAFLSRMTGIKKVWRLNKWVKKLQKMQAKNLELARKGDKWVFVPKKLVGKSFVVARGTNILLWKDPTFTERTAHRISKGDKGRIVKQYDKIAILYRTRRSFRRRCAETKRRTRIRRYRAVLQTGARTFVVKLGGKKECTVRLGKWQKRRYLQKIRAVYWVKLDTGSREGWVAGKWLRLTP